MLAKIAISVNRSSRDQRRARSRNGGRSIAGPRGGYYLVATMSATSIKLPPDLKNRVAAAAKAAGQSPHAFMLTAIEQQTALAEARRAFVQQALDARSAVEESGVGYDAHEVHAYMTARARGRRAERPTERSWRG